MEEFVVLGITYRHADLEVRDQVSFTDSRKIDFLHNLESRGMTQCLILSTCNRCELAGYLTDCEQIEELKQCFLEEFPQVEQLEKILRLHRGNDALTYFFSVTAGLESQVLGEDQITGQVKEAMDFSRTMGFGGKELDQIVRNALHCAKKIKSTLRISELPLSVSYLGIQRLKQLWGIQGKRVFLIGSGKTAALALRYVVQEGAERISLCSRNFSHARELRTLFPALRIVEYADRYQETADSDILISATAAPHLILEQEKLRVRHPMIFLDLAAPRDLDPRLGDQEQITLVDLDHLTQEARENQRQRESLKQEGEELIARQVEETRNWFRLIRLDPTIQSLQQRCQEIVEDSYQYLDRKLELTRREQIVVKQTLNASLQRLLRDPIQELKGLENPSQQDQATQLVQKLFRI